jgi:hypothetical protein
VLRFCVSVCDCWEAGVSSAGVSSLCCDCWGLRARGEGFAREKGT